MGGGRREGDAVSDWYRQEGTYPPPPPPGGQPPPARSTTWWPLAVAAGLVVVALSSLAVVIAVRSGGDEPEAAPMPSRGAVRLEPVTYRNPAPFTKSVVAGDVRVLPGRVVGSTSADIPAPRGAVTGDTVHLYASTSTAPVCDKAALAERLRSDRKVATAWASASGIEPAGTDGMLASLTPVVLRADTAVTNHVYRSGEPVAYQSVLQAGTPVMVDQTGLPRVQCSCGNPLLAPAEKRPTKTDGNGWKTFDEAQVVSVAPSPTPLPTITTVDLDTSKPATTATGSNTVLDGTLVAATDGLHVSTPDGQLVKVLDQQVDAVFDDGRGGLVYTLADPNDVARNERPATVEQSTIWHLPAGSTEAVALIPPAQEGGWNVLEEVGSLGGRTYLVYGSKQMHPNSADGSFGSLVAHDLDSSAETELVDQAYGFELGVSSVSFGGDRLVVQSTAEAWLSWMIFGPGPAQIPDRCSAGDSIMVGDAVADMPCPTPGVLDPSGRILGLDVAERSAAPPTVIWSDPVTGERGRGATLQAFAGADRWDDPFQVTPQRLVVEGSFSSGHHWRIHNLSDGSLLDLPLGNAEVSQLWILKAPLVRPKAADPTTPTTQPPYRPVTVDELKAGFPSVVCGDDVGPIPIGPEGYGANGGDPVKGTFVQITFKGQALEMDVDGDGIAETVVVLACNGGGTAVSTLVAAMRMGPNGIETVGEPLGNFGGQLSRHAFGGMRQADSIAAVDGGVEVSGEEWADDDPHCCGSLTFTARFRFADGRWQKM